MLKNVSFWLWDNRDTDEGLHIVGSYNYGEPDYKRFYSSMRGAQTFRQWTGFNKYQPESSKMIFAEFKQRQKANLREFDGDWWASKFAMDAQPKGTVIIPGGIVLMSAGGEYAFECRIQDREFRGLFDPTGLTAKQRNPRKGVCLGHWSFREEDQAREGALW